MSTDLEDFYIEHLLDGIEPLCACGCKGRVKWWGWKVGFPSKVLRGHNVLVDDSSFRSKETLEKANESRQRSREAGEWIVWNTGLTKETDERLAAAAEKKSKTLTEGYESGRLACPRKGQTKETYEPIAKQISTLRRKREQGLLPFSWNEGLTKETDERVARAAASVSAARRADDWMRLTEDDLKARVAEQDAFDLVTSYSEYRTKYQHLEFRCRKMGHVQFKTIKMLRDNPVCWDCDPKSSYGQLEIREFVESLGFDVLYEDRTIISPKEIDIYVPSKKFGIEYNSLYYHSSRFLPDDYHAEKTKMCGEKGATLLHVFSDEWKHKRPIVESMIRGRLGKIDRRIFARACEIREISSTERNEFFNTRHLDGDARANMAWGLFHEGQLVAALSVRTPQSEKRRGNRELEVCRFASSRNTIVVGALGKLTQKAIEYARANEFDSLMSYVDERCGTGRAYSEVGYDFVGTTGANRYWYTDGAHRYPRQMYRADRAAGLTEAMVADQAGVVKIFGCSNLIFERKVQK